MTPWEQRLLNVSSGGSLFDKTLTEICNLINNMVEDFKHANQDEYWYEDAPSGFKEFNTPHIEAQISKLRSAVIMLAKDKGVQPASCPCGICSETRHPTYVVTPKKSQEIKILNSTQIHKFFYKS